MKREKSCEKISEGNVKMLCNVRQRMWWNENRKLKGGTEWKRRKGRKGGGMKTYVNTCCYTWESTSVRGSLSETAYSVADKAKKTFLTPRNDVWRQFYCAFHSVGRFEIQARILLCPNEPPKVRLEGEEVGGDV